MGITAARTDDRHEPTTSRAGLAIEALLDLEFEAFCAREAADDVTLDDVLRATAGIPGGMAEAIIEGERADRF